VDFDGEAAARIASPHVPARLQERSHRIDAWGRYVLGEGDVERCGFHGLDSAREHGYSDLDLWLKKAIRSCAI
jgi:hypothetical protein